MELNISKQPVYIRETLLEAELEQPVECDVLLPDYCDDIQKILKCTLEPVFTRRQAEGTRLELEGICLVTVYYRSPQGRLCRGEYKVPFARTAELRGEAACPVIWTQGVCGYVSCRAVSSRRLDIRGAATLRAAVANLREQQAVASAEGTGVQLRQCSCQGTRVLLQASRTVSLCEDVELPESKGGVEAVLRVGAAARLLDCRVMAGKVILRGEAAVSCLYRTPEGRCETMDFTLPQPSGLGTPLTREALETLRKERGPSVFFSQDLCARYFTCPRGGSVHFILYDDADTLTRKLQIAAALGVGSAFLTYPELNDLLDRMYPRKGGQ